MPDRWHSDHCRAGDRVQHETGLRLHVARGSPEKTWSWSSKKAFHDPTPGPSRERTYLGRMGDRLLIFTIAMFGISSFYRLLSWVVSFLYPWDVLSSINSWDGTQLSSKVPLKFHRLHRKRLSRFPRLPRVAHPTRMPRQRHLSMLRRRFASLHRARTTRFLWIFVPVRYGFQTYILLHHIIILPFWVQTSFCWTYNKWVYWKRYHIISYNSTISNNR